MVRTCVDSVLADLSSLEKELPLISENSRLWADQILEKIQSCRSTKLECENWIVDLQGSIDYCKQKFEESCELLLQCSLRCKNKTNPKFDDFILENLKDLNRYKTDDEIVLVKNQMEILEKKLRLWYNLSFLIPKKWRGFKETREFEVVVHGFAHNSACLIFLYWVKAVDEEMATKLNILKDDFQILQEFLTFVIAFLANPPDQHVGDEDLKMITVEIEVLVKEDLYLVLSIDDMKGNFSQPNACLSDFMRKVELVKGKIQLVYGQIRDSFSYSIPKTNGLGFFDFLLQNLVVLKEKLKRDTDFIPFAKHLIISIEEELMSLRPYLSDLFEQQKEHEELKDTWLKVFNLAYQTKYAINSCSVIGHQLWYNMARLMEVLDEIKVVKIKLKKIEGRKTHDGGVLHCSTVALNKVREDPWTSGFNQVMVGLEEEVVMIVENLIKRSNSLDIVAIVGMAGLGNTTLTNKVYNDLAVRHHFHMFAYCIVSQIHNARKIFFDILGDITGKDDKMYDMKEEDLAEMLRKCLKPKWK